MNAARRKELDRAATMLDDAKAIIDSCMEEENEAFESLPEGIQSSERGQAMEDVSTVLAEAIDEIDGALENINEAKGGS